MSTIADHALRTKLHPALLTDQRGLADRDPRWEGLRELTLPTPLGDLRAITVDRPATGTPHLLVHGLGVSSVTWLDAMVLLADEGPVVAIDLPGFGYSEPRAGTRVDLDTLTAAIEHARQSLGWDRMVLHGNSLGGLLAARHAQAHPATMEHLVLSSPAFSPGPAGLRQLSVATLIGIGPLVVPGVGEAALSIARRRGEPFPGAQTVRSAVFANPEQLRPSLRALFEEESAGLGRERWRRDGMLHAARALAPELAAWWRTDRLSQSLPSSTTIVAGAEDRLLPRASIDRLAANRPDLPVHILDRAGHSPFVERPLAYLQAVLGEQISDMD